MLAVLSPAKSLDPSPPPTGLGSSQPVLMKEATSLMRTARGLSQKKLRELMSISADLAKLNYDRYRSFDLPFHDDNALPAAITFDGEVYRGLDARTLDPDALGWSQEHVAILSGMFGLLRPLDLIQPYRLEMGTRLKTRRGTNLYQYWGKTITDRVNEILSTQEDRTLVNLASNEYFKAIRPKALDGGLITCVFEDYKDAAETPNVISFMAKRARGRMARYMIEERVSSPEALKAFDYDRYTFRSERSTDDRFVFGRTFIPVGG